MNSFRMPCRGLCIATLVMSALWHVSVDAGAPAEPTNAEEAAAKKQAEEAAVNEKYAALVATLPPEEQAWEKILQDNLGGFYLPLHKRDKVAGRSNAWDFVKDDSALPRVLLIGDSVSRGYTQAVRTALAGKANVHRAPANCGPTASGIKNIEAWLGDGKWDVIHFNFGIHDRNTPVGDYASRLELLVDRMEKTGARLVWASTTPIPDNPAAKQSAVSIVECNAAAAATMQKRGVATDDLFAFITPRLAEAQLPNDVHFTKKGYDLLGQQVADAIAKALASPGDQEPRAAAADGSAVPRYRFTPGQTLVYESSLERDGAPAGGPIERLHVWVVEARGGGGARLVLRKDPLKNGAVDESRSMLGYADIAADGACDPNPTLGPTLPIRNFFPRLPGSPQDMTRGWREADRISGLEYGYALLPDAAGFACTMTGELIDGGTTGLRYLWDDARGIAKEIAFRTGRKTVLASAETVPADAAAAIRRDADAYFAALFAHARRLDGATRMPVEAAARDEIAAARAEFVAVVDRIHAAEIKPLARRILANLDTAAVEICKPGGIRERTSRVLGKPLPAWVAKDLDGKMHTGKDYRGRVVVADFWYRSCPPCIMAMPQVKAIAAHFKGRPVAVLGMNVDEDEADAVFMAKQLAFPYPTLLAKPLEPVFHMQDFGYPTLFIIDQEGVLRTMRIGFSPTLAEEVTEEVERLLAEPPRR